MTNVAVFGLGYVGSVTAACLASAGHRVVGVDLAEPKVAAVSRGDAPLAEPGLSALMRKGVADGLLTATVDAAEALADADIAIICVGTPSAPNGALSTHYVEGVAAEIAEFLRSEASRKHLTVVFRSTLLPGTTERLAEEYLSGSGLHSVAYCPEFLRESTAIADFKNPPFTIVGTDKRKALEDVTALFSSVSGSVRHVSIATAEAVKYASNAFHAVKITFANEMGRFADAFGVDSASLMEVFVEDRILNISEKYLRPGFAFGGSCLPKDVRAVTNAAKRADVSLPLIDSLLNSNEVHVRRLVDHVLQQRYSSVALLGLAFKSNTDDLRESPYVEVAERLLGKGIEVRIFDDVVDPHSLVGSNESYVRQHLPHLAKLMVASREAAVAGVDVVILGSDQVPPDFEALSLLPVIDSNASSLAWSAR